MWGSGLAQTDQKLFFWLTEKNPQVFETLHWKQFKSLPCPCKGHPQTTHKPLLPLFLSAADPAVWCELSPGSPYWWGTQYLLKASPVKIKEQAGSINVSHSNWQPVQAGHPAIAQFISLQGPKSVTNYEQQPHAELLSDLWWLHTDVRPLLWAELGAQPLRTRVKGLSLLVCSSPATGVTLS